MRYRIHNSHSFETIENKHCRKLIPNINLNQFRNMLTENIIVTWKFFLNAFQQTQQIVKCWSNAVKSFFTIPLHHYHFSITTNHFIPSLQTLLSKIQTEYHINTAKNLKQMKYSQRYPRRRSQYLLLDSFNLYSGRCIYEKAGIRSAFSGNR